MPMVLAARPAAPSADPRPPSEDAPGADDAYPDGLIAAMAIDRLRRLSEAGQPFFLAVGFFKPHLPFNAPRRYWNMYDPAAIPPAPHLDPPANINPQISIHRSEEFFNYDATADPRTDPRYAAELRHAYSAAVSYIDAQVGELLDALHELGLDSNTIVVLWSDHGWHLGDLGMWGKHSAFERSLHSPLIIRTPGIQRAGAPAVGLVESLDLYRTLADLCRLPAPQGVAGTTLRPMLENPDASLKSAAFGYWRRGDLTAHTVRTERYRLVRWFRGEESSQTLQIELYDHATDPHETANIAAQHPQVVAKLLSLLHDTR